MEETIVKMAKTECFKCGCTYHKEVDEWSELIEEQHSTADEDLCPSCSVVNDWAEENKLNLSFAVNTFRRSDGIEFYVKRVKTSNQFVVVNVQDEVLFTAENYFWANDWARRNTLELEEIKEDDECVDDIELEEINVGNNF